MLTDGKPTITRIVAWLAHEGINKNRLAFVRDDLAQACAKIGEPDFLPMDFNHSAITGFGWDQKAIGVWYRAEMAQDPEANDAWGILATGMMWSWLNPEIADRLLAEQSRNGRMDFSMACICGTVTPKSDADGPFEEAGNTVFFTLSALDVPPADPNATGKGVEGSTDPNLEADLRKELKGGSVTPPSELARAASAAPSTPPAPAAPSAPNGGKMDELLAQLKTLTEQATKLADANLKQSLLEVLETKISEVSSKIEAKTARETEVEAQLAAKTAEVETLKAELLTVQSTVAELEKKPSADEVDAKLAEANVAKDAAVTQLEQANAEIERLAAELATAKASLGEFQAAEAQKEVESKLASRIAELPEAYRTAFEARSEDEQTKAKARWSEMSDEQWTAFKADIGMIPMAKSYLARSLDEGRLPTSAPAKHNAKSRLSQYK
jgi:hypothetical protein